MSLRLVRSASSRALWSACASRFLDEAGDHPGPDVWPTRLWVAHRAQRDALYALAARRGLPGWLDPPVSFFSELPRLFGIRARPVGLLTGRLLVARLAAREGWQRDLRAVEGGPARAHMLDAVFSELLPEGVTPAELRTALDRLEGDEFARRRSRWVADTYAAFLAELEARDRYDLRAVHAMVAARIEAGDLRRALRGATRLHVYGITSLRGRRRLFRALAEQPEVLVSVYLPLEEEPGASEWERLPDVEAEDVRPTAPAVAAPAEAPGPAEAATPAEPPGAVVVQPAPGAVIVQPAPDALREARWVAGRIKRLLVEDGVEPHEIAVVARSGRHDTRLIHRALESAGIPATARIRTLLAQVPALKGLLTLYRGQRDGWPYRSLREVLDSPYFRIQRDGSGVDLRIIDYLSRQRRMHGLAGWAAAIQRTLDVLRSDERWKLRGEGVYEDRVEEAVAAFASFRETVAPLAGTRAETGWIVLTLEILSGRWFGFRRRLCRPAGDRWDVVRLDQRGVVRLEELLREWRELLEDGTASASSASPPRSPRTRSPREPFGVEEWHDRLRRLLEANEIALSTPRRTGVQVLEAHEAALTPYRHTFVVHANDGEFPRTTHSASVFSEEERRRLQVLGLPLTSREEALRRERALWRAVVGGDSVTVTYRTTDANGVPRLASLMVPEHDPGTEIPRTVEVEEREAREAVAPISPEELRRREVRRLARVRTADESAPFETPYPARLRHAALAAFAEELRAGRLDGVARIEADLAGPAEAGGASAAVAPADVASAFGVDRPLSLRPHPWNGKLRDPAVRAWLEERFDDAYVWSASQLQAYSVRPFDFFLDRVLRIGDVEEAEEETSPIAYGSVVHAVLERFYREATERFPALPEALEGEAEQLYERAFREACGAAEADADNWLGLPIHWAVRRRDIERAVREFLEHELGKLAGTGTRPILLEHAFGGSGSDGSPPVRIEGKDARGRPASLLLRGRIDRVDRKGGEGGRLTVIDYKTGGYPPGQGHEDGSTLQTALYLRALELLGHENLHLACFRSVKRKTMEGAKLGRDGVEPVLRFALSIPRRVRAGRFEAVQCRAVPIAHWQPGLEVIRCEARLDSGSRFDLVRGEPDDEARDDDGSERPSRERDDPESAGPDDSEGDDPRRRGGAGA